MLVRYLVNRPSLWRPVSWGRRGSGMCGATAVLSTPSIISSVMVVSSFLIKIISANTVHSGLYYWSQQFLIAAFRRTAHNDGWWTTLLSTYSVLIAEIIIEEANNYENGFRARLATLRVAVATLPSTFKKILTSLSKLSLSTTDLCSPH